MKVRDENVVYVHEIKFRKPSLPLSALPAVEEEVLAKIVEQYRAQVALFSGHAPAGAEKNDFHKKK